MYQAKTIVVKRKQKALYNYCKKACEDAKLLKNAVIFRCRQIIFADRKEYKYLHELERQVLEEFNLIEDKIENKKIYIPNYYQFDRMFRDTENPDFFNDLSMQISQNIIKAVLADFRSYFKSIKKYAVRPEEFEKKPNFPKYVKGTQAGFDISNEDAVIKVKKNERFLKLPKTKATVPLGDMKTGTVKEVTIKPFYDTYKICISMETDDVCEPHENNDRIIGIDLGVNNFASVNNNCGLTPFIINGRILKSYNQWYNKKLAELRSFAMKAGKRSSKRIKQLNKAHYNRTKDFYDKAASYIVRYCIRNDIGTIVVGKNNGWKQDINIGHENNQTFCFIAHAAFIEKLIAQAVKYGIIVFKTEESYTSKADLLSLDDMEGGKDAHFSGRRIKRGLYKSGTGVTINADINGAGNIIRKIFKNAFSGIDMSYMTGTIEVVNIA